MKLLRISLLCAVVVLLAGCARVTTTTTLHADGSFTRKNVYTVLPSMSPGTSEGQKKKENPEDYFKLPAKGPGVDIVRSQEKDKIVATVTREVAAGSPPLPDITLWDDKGKAMATSTVSVTKLSDGRIEYVETLHRLEPPKSVPPLLAADLRARVKKAIPAEYQKTELIDDLTKRITLNLAYAIMGPPEPNFFNLILSPDSTIRRINTLAFTSNVRTFKAAIPSLTDRQASMMARSLVDLLNMDALNADKASPEASSGNSNENEMTPLFYSIKFPGTVVDTDGLVDPMTGEVYWSLLPMVLDLGDVKLRAVIRP